MRVLLAAARRESLFALTYLLGNDSSMEVVCEVSDATASIDSLALSAAINVALSGSIDVVVLDLADSRLDDGEHGAFMALSEMVPVVAVGARRGVEVVVRLRGEEFVYRGDPPTCLLDALRTLSAEVRFGGDSEYESQLQFVNI